MISFFYDTRAISLAGSARHFPCGTRLRSSRTQRMPKTPVLPPGRLSTGVLKGSRPEMAALRNVTVPAVRRRAPSLF